MKKISLLLLFVLFISTVAVSAQQRGLDNPVTKAVLTVYDNMLRENPDDYMTWFRRANEYYRHNEYMKALKDINEALQRVPVGDSD